MVTADGKGGSNGLNGVTIWLDKACLDQRDIQASLAGLPVFISGCKNLLVLAGDTYASRLWCVIELFVFVQLHEEKDEVKNRMIVKPLSSTLERERPRCAASPSFSRTLWQRICSSQRETRPSPSTASSKEKTSKDLQEDFLLNFDASTAETFDPNDQERLMAVIEASFGTLEPFNEIVRDISKSQLQVDTHLMPASNPSTRSVSYPSGRAVQAHPQRTPSARQSMPRAALTCAGDSGRVGPGAGAVVRGSVPSTQDTRSNQLLLSA
jgi:hypothetical protein